MSRSTHRGDDSPVDPAYLAARDASAFKPIDRFFVREPSGII